MKRKVFLLWAAIILFVGIVLFFVIKSFLTGFFFCSADKYNIQQPTNFSGQIFDKITNKPIANATVEVFSRFNGGSWVGCSYTPSIEMISDKNGRFSGETLYSAIEQVNVDHGNYHCTASTEIDNLENLQVGLTPVGPEAIIPVETGVHDYIYGVGNIELPENTLLRIQMEPYDYNLNSTVIDDFYKLKITVTFIGNGGIQFISRNTNKFDAFIEAPISGYKSSLPLKNGLYVFKAGNGYGKILFSRNSHDVANDGGYSDISVSMYSAYNPNGTNLYLREQKNC